MTVNFTQLNNFKSKCKKSLDKFILDDTIASLGFKEIKNNNPGPTCFTIQQDCYQTFVYSWFKVQKQLMSYTKLIPNCTGASYHCARKSLDCFKISSTNCFT